MHRSVAAFRRTWRQGMVLSTLPQSFTGGVTTALSYVVLSTVDLQDGEGRNYGNLDFAQYLNLGARETIERWACRSAEAQDYTEAALRAVISKDGTAFRQCIERIHPGVGENGKRLQTVFPV